MDTQPYIFDSEFALGLKCLHQGDSRDLIYAVPDFHKTILDVKYRLKEGSAEWRGFEEVFCTLIA
jgi:hypothetical protein